MNKRTLVAAAIAMALAIPAGAKQLSEQESDEVLAKGEVLWGSSKSPTILVRHAGKVFVCQFAWPTDFYRNNEAVTTICWDKQQ